MTVYFLSLIFLQTTATAQKIDVVFAGPEAEILQHFGKTDPDENLHKGIAGITIDKSNVETFRKVAPKYLKLIYEQVSSSSTMKKWMRKGMKISENSMELTYVLIDDTKGLVKDELSVFSIYKSATHKGKSYVWPMFGNDLVDKKKSKYHGWIYIGEGSCITMVEDLKMGEKALSNLTLNQAVRAQFFGNPTSWPYLYKPRRGLISMDYNPYRAEEPIYTLGTVVEEATGYFFNGLYNNEERQQLGVFFRNNARKYAISEENKLYKNGKWIPKNQNNFKYQGRHFYSFRWNEMPAEKLMHFPSTTLFLYHFLWKYSPEREQALEMIIEASNKMWNDFDHRNPFYATHFLAYELEDFAATEEGKAAQRRGELVSPMLPYALMDFLTHYDLTNTEMADLFGKHKTKRQNKALAAYIGGHRAVIKKQLAPYLDPHHKIREEGVIQLFTYLKKSVTR